MASGTITPAREREPQRPEPANGAEYESFIEDRLLYTRRQVKLVDVASALMLLVAGTLGWLLMAALLDHWIVPGGLGFWSRLLMFLGWLGAAGSYSWSAILPPLVQRINPVYAAQTIEHSRPTLKNSLINFLLLRGHRREVLPVVYRALEQRAAADLSQVEIQHAVDRGRVVRLGYVLAALVAVFALYTAFCKKDTLASAARVLWPWARIQAPTRVVIDDVRPGDAIAYYGESVKVTANVLRLGSGEGVTLFYSTADGQSVDQAVPMNAAGEGNHYECALPPGEVGFQQTVSYRLIAGDAVTPWFKIDVQVAPAILVDQIDYQFPSYTGIARQSVQGQGDVRALEGTRVTVRATANQEIKEAEIDLGCVEKRGLRMDSSGKTAIGQFTLRLDPQDPAKAQYECYKVLFTDVNGRTNRRPVRYNIEVVRDAPPEIQIVQPTEEEVKLPLDGELVIHVKANDDFALRRVVIKAETSGRSLSIRPLLDDPRSGKAVHSTCDKEYVFRPAVLGLKAGDRVTYWAEADDNKEPQAGHSETGKKVIEILRPESAQQLAKADQPQPTRAKRDPEAGPEKPRQKQPGENQPKPNPDQPGKQDEQPNGAENKPEKAKERPGDKNAKGEKRPGDPENQPGESQGEGSQATGSNDPGSQAGGSGPNRDQTGNSAEPQGEPVNPENAGDVFEKSLKDLKQQQEQKGQQAGEQKSGKGAQQGEKDQSGSQQGEKTQPSGGQEGTKDQPGGTQQGEKTKPSGGQQGAKDQPGGGQQGEKTQPSGGQEGAKDQSGGGQRGEKTKPSGGQQGSKDQSGGGQQGEKTQPSGRQEGAKDQSGGGQQGEKTKPSGGQQGSKDQQGGGQQGEKMQPSGGQEGAKDQPGGTQQGEKTKPAGGQQNAKDQQGGGQQGEKMQPKPGSQSGGQSSGSGEKPQTKEKRPGEQQGGSQDQSGGQKSKSGENSQQQQPGGGSQSKKESNPSAAQGGNQPRQQTAGKNSDSPSNSPESPSTSKQESKNQQGQSGDRSGDGEEGAGQKADKKGTGTAGNNTPSEEGGSRANEKGPGETGSKAGDQVKSKGKAGSPKDQSGQGTGQEREQPGKEGPSEMAKETPQKGSETQSTPDKRTNGGQAGDADSRQGGSRGAGNPTAGDGRGNQPEGNPTAKNKPRGEDPANLEFAKKQVDLALEHLKHETGKDKSQLLEQLGWSRDDARKFIEKWQSWEATARQQGPKAETARKSYNEALKSLGLRPRGTQLGRGNTASDRLQNLRDAAGQSEPPADWAEAFRAYTKESSSKRD